MDAHASVNGYVGKRLVVVAVVVVVGTEQLWILLVEVGLLYGCGLAPNNGSCSSGVLPFACFSANEMK